MKYKLRFLMSLLLIATVIVYGCRKAYTPPAIAAFANILVVEGDISSGGDSTIIKLSHTVKVSSKTVLNPEGNAQVAVESDQNASYPLTEIKPGVYASAGLNLDKTHQYRLSIHTSAGKQYESDLMAVLDSPPIDSVSYDAKGSPIYGDGVNLYVSTHDPNNKVHFFRWDFNETWEFHPAFESYYKSNGDTVLPRDMVNDNIYQCWKSDTSTSTLLASDAQLSQSVIINNPLTFIHSTDEKVTVKYSILVKQHALTAAAFNFYAALKKNTEQIGGIFDAQPTELQGNIHSVNDPAEAVIGYVSIGNVSTLRIFIDQRNLPYWTAITFYTLDNCHLAPDPQDPRKGCCYYVSYDDYGNLVNQVDRYINYNIYHNEFPFIPVTILSRPGSPPLGYTAAVPECVDCTLRGSKVPPPFWQ